jgi:hypothetical protein
LAFDDVASLVHLALPEAAQTALIKSLPLTAMKLLSPALVTAMTHKSWQAKVCALGICGDLAARVPDYFMRTVWSTTCGRFTNVDSTQYACKKRMLCPSNKCPLGSNLNMVIYPNDWPGCTQYDKVHETS